MFVIVFVIGLALSKLYGGVERRAAFGDLDVTTSVTR